MKAPVDCEIRTTLPATPEAVEEFFREFRRQTGTVLAHATRFAAELMTREAVNNAVIHGCGADSRMQVRCVLRLRDRRLVIAVADDGEGFDWRAAWDRSSVPAAVSGRGIEVLRKYATRVRFNERGNAVTIFKRCC